jgi:membrane protease YdiL (CAAX protease family)
MVLPRRVQEVRVPHDPHPPRRPRLWDAWTHGQLVIFALLLLGAEMFWWMVIYRLTEDAFAASLVAVVLAVLLPCAAAAWWHGETLARTFQLRPTVPAALVGVAAGLLSWAPASYLASLSSRLHPPSPEYLQLIAENLPRDAADVALAYLAVAVAAPIGEELIFRGILFRVARERWGWVRAAVLTGLFFGVAHWAPWHLFGLVALGLLLALLYHLTRSLLAPMLSHATYNLVSITLLIQAGGAAETPTDEAARGMTAGEWLLLGASTLLLAGLVAWLWHRAARLAAVRPGDEDDQV